MPDIDVRFGANAVRLSAREWGIAILLTTALLGILPFAWWRFKPLRPGEDYRLPFRLGQDYSLYARMGRTLCTDRSIAILGDSVVWGHYVSNEQTLSHYLNRMAGERHFVNLGVDGIHPSALDGLIVHYAPVLKHRDVILHCNLLWMSSPRQDLQIHKEFAFNHPDLVPQFFPRIPCYRKSLSGRLGTVVGREVRIAGWTRHVRIAYFDGKDLPSWTLDHPYGNPLARLNLPLPSPAEPPTPVPVAKSWTEQGFHRFHAAWVDPETSIQWHAFQRAVDHVLERKNRLLVIVGPFNEHMLTPESLQQYLAWKKVVEAWLTAKGIPHVVPAVLPSEMYADASHPLAQGYALLAKQLAASKIFRDFTHPASAL